MSLGSQIREQGERALATLHKVADAIEQGNTQKACLAMSLYFDQRSDYLSLLYGDPDHDHVKAAQRMRDNMKREAEKQALNCLAA